MEVAQHLARKLRQGDVLALDGDLGAGKTTFTKGLAKGLHIQKNVTSPTFMIIKEYEGRLPLFHMDVYRLDDAAEDLGFDEYFEGDGVTVVEWAGRIADQLPPEHLHVTIRYTDEHERIILFKPFGDRYVSLCKEMQDEGFGD